jgi:hypothetical protein
MSGIVGRRSTVAVNEIGVTCPVPIALRFAQWSRVRNDEASLCEQRFRFNLGEDV